ncbi:gp079 [Rhodococcus phage ReqiPoco6]|uniref:Gp079 n=1 Tax=Rhodococcus phage ReqiPoco6 TaxID=691964 RepID=D4P7U7_9CAUD|nr:gp079 [Rhodococcus phage ReqiPoco6]ADD81077.1 gp079 [Rhodococcus phage ReqiPoco6]
MTFDKVIDPAIFSGRRNPGNVVPAIPDGLVLATELPRGFKPPRLRLEFDSGKSRYGIALYLSDEQQRNLAYLNLDSMALRYAVGQMANYVGTPELIDFHRDVCFWTP